MDNADFRKLLAKDAPRTQNDTAPSRSGIALGARHKSSHGSRNVAYAQQFASQNSINRPTQVKKFKSSTPAVKLAEGFRDRTLDRQKENADDDSLEQRLKNLEEQVKLGTLAREDFEKLRDQLTGGDVSKTHLVRGLDRRLLERVRQGEDVFSGNESAEGVGKDEVITQMAEDEFDELEKRSIAPVDREKAVKKGELAPPPPIAGTKRSRNDILADWKAQKQAKAEVKLTQQSTASSKFRKVGTDQVEPSSRIEIDAKGREVLITVDENGKVKKKVRPLAKAPQTAQATTQLAVMKPTGKKAPIAKIPLLDADVVVPDLPWPDNVDEDDDDDDIFKDVGDDYDPLGEAADSGNSDEEDGGNSSQAVTDSKPARDAPTSPQQPRNYFNDGPVEPKDETNAQAFQDPAILAALQRAAAIAERQATADGNQDDDAGSKQARPSTAAERLLARQDRDYEDMDMGFGSSRGADEEDGEGERRVKLSEWKGGIDGDDDDGKDRKGRGGQQRKRGKSKKKGDKNSAADVLRVMESRKKQ